MKRLVQNMFLVLVTLFIGPVPMAYGDEPPISPFGLFCSDNWGIPTDEGFFGIGGYCYKIEVTCNGDVSGGFWGQVGNPDWHVGGHMESVAGPPDVPGPDRPSCAMDWGVHHWDNSKFEHTCTYDGFGKFELEAKRVPDSKCF